MENQLELVARSYDKGIDFGRRGIDLYKGLPEQITDDPDYPVYQKVLMEGASNSGNQNIMNYLSPTINMKFIDLGCCLNLMFRGYDGWPSTYYGVDISSKTIQLLNEFISKNHLSVGSFYNGSIHDTPFENSYFDIGACIGVLEYFEKDFIEKAIVEAHRIIKPEGKLVLDIPSITSPSCRIMMLIEEHLGRPERFDMSAKEFEDMLQNYFKIERMEKDDSWAMFQYYVSCKK